MGRKFDELNGMGYKSPVNEYLKSRGFYTNTMNPRFMNGCGYDKLTTGKHCLRHDSSINNDCTLRIFINETDIYFEVENAYRSYETSGRYEPEDYPTVKDIDALLDEIVRLNNLMYEYVIQ